MRDSSRQETDFASRPRHKAFICNLQREQGLVPASYLESELFITLVESLFAVSSLFTRERDRYLCGASQQTQRLNIEANVYNMQGII